MNRILIVSAHPDDMEIGMGGTVAKMAAAGDSILSVVLTDGRRAPDPTMIGPEKMVEARREESKMAASVLGILESRSFDFESLNSDEICFRATKDLIEVIDSFDPKEIFTLHPDLDRHPSHRAAGKITINALTQCSNVSIKLWAYEVWGLFDKWDRFENITEQMSTKLRAINAHQSQVAAIPYGEGIAGLNRWRAVFADPHQTEVEAEFAEVFVKLNY
jgi:N-acetylglucosamine malate deacetylase 1